MKMSNVDEGCEVVDVPVSALLSEERKNRYGSVAWLEDDELASPEELERQVVLQEWGPILSLPVRGNRSGLRPSVDEDGRVDFGAFATVDFERSMPEFDKARYKADKLREELRDALIQLSVIRYRLTKGQLKVLKYLRMGVLGFDAIEDVETRQVGRLYLRALRLQKEIRELRDASWQRRRRELGEVLG
ncbi:MAG: hypothetical protein JXA69_08310 [Phycisphaerae bacterium]|nr:hypothetical protein [Phycisphaerae bacterium]